MGDLVRRHAEELTEAFKAASTAYDEGEDRGYRDGYRDALTDIFEWVMYLVIVVGVSYFVWVQMRGVSLW